MRDRDRKERKKKRREERRAGWVERKRKTQKGMRYSRNEIPLTR